MAILQAHETMEVLACECLECEGVFFPVRDRGIPDHCPFCGNEKDGDPDEGIRVQGTMLEVSAA